MATKPRSKEEVLTASVADLFNTISHEEVLFTEKEGHWKLGGRQLTEAQLKQYAEEATILKSLVLWKEIDKCIKYMTNRKMFLHSKTIEDMVAGKLMLYLLKTIDDIATTAQRLVANKR